MFSRSKAGIRIGPMERSESARLAGPDATPSQQPLPMQLTVMHVTDCVFTAEAAVVAWAAVPSHEAMVDLAIAVTVEAAATTDTAEAAVVAAVVRASPNSDPDGEDQRRVNISACEESIFRLFRLLPFLQGTSLIFFRK